MELNNIICELSNLLPQLSGFIDQFNSLVVSSGVNVFTDHVGNMSVDIPNSMTDVDASNVVKRLSIIDRLINTQGSAINDLLQAGMKIEKELKKYGEPEIGNHSTLLQNWKKAHPDLIIARWKKEAEKTKEEIKTKDNQIAQLQEELQLEREEAKKALQKAQEWRERQLKEITEQKDQEIKILQEKVKQLESQLANYIQVPPK